MNDRIQISVDRVIDERNPRFVARSLQWFLLTTLVTWQIGAGADEIKNRNAELLRYVQTHEGDALQGEKLFHENSKLLCTRCHNVSGQEKAGPDLEGIADKYNQEELVEQILQPSKSLKPGFEEAIVITVDGLIHRGRVERANQTETRLFDAEGQRLNIPAEKIQSTEMSAVSMMPENLTADLTDQEFADLIAYLQTLKFQSHQGFVRGGKPIEIPRAQSPISFEPIHPPTMAFENPVWCGGLPSTEQDLVVVEQHTSKIWRVIRDGEHVRKELFLDLSGQTHRSGNQGLMCVAFHPDYATNHRYFLEHEVKEEGEVKTVIVERRAASDGLRDSGTPSRRLLDVVQPAFNHNGGCLTFGPDGMLYIAFGDGGPQLDPHGNSQNPRVLLGSMLRIDVDHRDSDRQYAIPPDNPFVEAHRKDPSIRPETWAIGLREPWRFSFDTSTRELYVGDVGQDKYEEVSIVRRGENHGWNVREAFAPFSQEYRREGEIYSEPIFAYEHGLGFSVTGGYVYRGKANPSFHGVYIFGDYNTRRVWGLKQQAGVVDCVLEIGTSPGSVASFGVDQHGELYLVSYLGTIYHLDFSKAEFP